MVDQVYGSIEAGGTKFVCAVGTGPADVRAETRFPTTSPDETIGRAIAFFAEQRQRWPLAAIGVGAFGPIDLRRGSTTYGYVTSTPKPGWMNADFVGRLRSALHVPVGFDTDVNAAALGEHRWGAAQAVDSCVYITIGTGIGAGLIINGQPVHGLVHPEAGHMLLRHDRESDPFPGACPYHGDCFEGLASGPALKQRWGRPAEELTSVEQVWQLEAHYIALALVNLICVVSPQRIVLGGGVMQNEFLFPLIRRKVQKLLNGYVQSPDILHRIDGYIVPPGLGNRSGMLGAIVLAQLAGNG